MTSPAKRLTFERLHSDPPLEGELALGPEVSPGGSRVLYQKPREGNSEILDLWQFIPASGEHTELLRAEDLVEGQRELSDEEKARLERERISKSGITHYSFSETGEQVLVPLAGQLFVVRLSDRTITAIRGDETKLDPRLSPDGSRVAFVQDSDLYVQRLDANRANRLTRDGSKTVVNGLAEFIAQEEMDRGRGFWWSPTGDRIAFIQYDESPVRLVDRVAIGGDGATLTQQRYPLAGTENVKARVGVVTLTGKTTWVELGDDADIYIARVDWNADGSGLFVQRLDREQERLELLSVDPETGESRVLIEESSSTWVNLHDDLHPLDDGRFVWSSERSGFRHVYIYGADGSTVTPATDGSWAVDKVHCVDEEAELVYFSAWRTDPTVRDLYRAPLDGSLSGNPERVSTGEGSHSVAAAEDCSLYLDTFSSPSQPPQTGLYDHTGKRLAWLTENALDDDHPYTPYLASHSETFFGTLPAEDGTPLHYKITRPHDFDAQQRYPVVVNVYGGPHVQRVKRAWNLKDQVWADLGYVVFTLDNRGSARRGHAFEAHLHRRLGDIEVRDQVAGVDFLKKKPFVDGDRIGVYGWSYGGYMAAMLLAKSDGAFAAGVVGAPVIDWRLYDTCYTERYLDHPEDNPDGYAQSSVLTALDGIDEPLLLIHGMADDNVVFTNSTRLMQDLQRAGKRFELMTYPGETHFFHDRRARLHNAENVASFFARHLQSGE
ncbi:MAG: S9 family peptidase [Myxococcota bacterium]